MSWCRAPGARSGGTSHELLGMIEAYVRTALPECYPFTHLEPLDDPASRADEPLGRPQGG